MDLSKLIRSNISKLEPYSSARDEYKGIASVYIDANENPHSKQYNRYPDPRQLLIKEKLAKIKHTDINSIFLGNGSDEAIDLVFRVFCEPRIDNVVIPDPTYGMYEVCADINDVECRKVLLEADFSLNADKILSITDKHTKVIFLCSPNNPSGNLFNEDEILKIVVNFHGIVVIDEAYIDFTGKESWIQSLDKYHNVIVLQTLSKAWGLAAIRLGMAFSCPEIIEYFNKVKYPYNINQLTQEFTLRRLDNESQKDEWVQDIIKERGFLSKALISYSFIKEIYPSEANYILIRTDDANQLYDYLSKLGIVVRNRNSVSLCQGCLRITVGTSEENKILLGALNKYQEK